MNADYRLEVLICARCLGELIISSGPPKRNAQADSKLNNLMVRLIFQLFLMLVMVSSLQAQNTAHADSTKIVSLMNKQEKCWNNGNIECFMETYWNSDSLKFIGKAGVTYGWTNTLNNYKKKYPDKSHMGILSFDIVSVQLFSGTAAFVVGKWDLKREMGDVGGFFSLIWRKIDGQWLIVSDHTS